jgi:hypothetical protein
MKMELSVANCFWLILPLLAWNIILGPRVRDTRITSDAHSPKWLLMAENAARILVFGLPRSGLASHFNEGRADGIHARDAGLLCYLVAAAVSPGQRLEQQHARTAGSAPDTLSFVFGHRYTGIQLGIRCHCGGIYLTAHLAQDTKSVILLVAQAHIPWFMREESYPVSQK